MSDALGDHLRAARERAGLSVRELAARMGVAKATIAEAEAGEEPRRSTLVAYLHALPELTADELLAANPSRAPMPPDDAWEHYRQLFGFEADLVMRRTRIDAEGNAFTRVETRGLRRIRSAMGDLRLISGGRRAFFQREPAELIEVRAPKGTRLRLDPRAGEVPQQQLAIPSTAARHGARLVQRHARRHAYEMAGIPHRDQETSGGLVSGISLLVAHPARHVSVVLELPRCYHPPVVEAFVWPGVHVPDPDAPDAAPVLHGAKLHPASSASGRTWRLRVERPFVGFKYGIGWQLP